MLLTCKLMFDWLKEAEMASKLEAAIAKVIEEGTVGTYDVKGRGNNPDSTFEVAQEVARKL
jgi:isocitrate/isopropylmalate dehydrogenase